ncbi:hypothetical protein Tco_0596112 [Tanacetum coccineum]
MPPTNSSAATPEFSQPDSSLVVPVFQKGDDPIDAINHMMSFLTAVVTSRYPTTNNQLRTSSNPRQQATIYDGKVTVQPVQGRHTSYAMETTRKIHTGASCQICFMANLSGNGSDAITEVHNSKIFEIVTYSIKVSRSCSSSEQSNDVRQEKECLMKTVSELKNKLELEENRNIEREIELEKQIKQLDNIIFKRGQSAQTVRMLTNSKRGYDYSSKQAIGFEKPFCLKKRIVVPDSDETLELSEKSRSKMLLKEQDPLFVKHTINMRPINYDILNNDYYKRFVRQTDLYCEHAYWKETSVPPLDPSHSSTTVMVEVPKELPTVSMVNTSLKKLKRHLTGFDQVVKERTTATAITEGTWGFEHTKACFRDEIIPFLNELKDIFNNFNQYLVEELADVQKVFYQMEQAVEQHRLESKNFEVKMNQVLGE